MSEPHAAVWDAQEFGERVEPHFPSMFAAARRVLKSDDLAWDAVQETLLRIWQLDILPDNPRGLLLKFVFPKCLEVLRAQRRRSFHEGHAWHAGAESAAGDADDPAAVAEQNEIASRIERQVATLPRDCRDVFSLRRCGVDYAQIADTLNVPVGTVRSRLHRARALLQARLNPVLRTDDPRRRERVRCVR